MSTEIIDYAAVLTDLEAKRAALDAAIAGLRTYLAGNPTGGPSASAASSAVVSSNGEVPAGAFLGKSIPEAAKLYLQIMKRKSTSRDIAEGLRRGGMESISKNFHGIVHAVLDRARKNGGEVIKIDRSHWGLAEWYPAGVRVVQNQEKAPKKRKKANRPKASPKTVKNAPATKSPESPIEETIRPEPKTHESPQKLINDFFNTNLDAEFSTQQIATALDLAPRKVGIIAGQLAFRKKLEKLPSGKFRRSMSREMPLAG